MALIKCPECGQENVSDTADSCPNCGYAVKKYFEQEKIKNYFAEQRQQQEAKRQQESEKLKPELEMKLNEIDNLPYPEKPSFTNTLFSGDGSGLTFVTIIALIILFLLGINSSIFIVLFVLLLVLWTPFWISVVYIDYKSSLSLYEEKVSDWEGYKEKRKNKIKEDYDYYADNLAKYGSRTTPKSSYTNLNTQSNVLKCPICGSNNVNRISTLNRSVSVATVGLASSKIGKQYECKNCKHKW